MRYSNSFRRIMVSLFVSPAIAICSPLAKTTAIEGTIGGKTTFCGVEFTDVDNFSVSKPVLFVKAAFRQYSFDGSSLYEFYVDAVRTTLDKDDTPNVQLRIESAWLKTSRGTRFTSEKSDRKMPKPEILTQLAFNKGTKMITDDLINGQSTSIGFNTSTEEYDTVFAFPALQKSEQRKLKDCIARLGK